MATNNILEFKMMELKLLEKSKEKGNIMSNQYKYLKWFLDNSEHFTDVDIDSSHTVSRQHDCQVKSCYYNCWKVVSCGNLKNLRYFEGYVWSKRVPIPLEHCWLVDSKGKVIDPTLIISGDLAYKQMKKEYPQWTRKDFDTSKKRFGDEYYGIEFPIPYLNKLVFKHRKTGGFLIELFLSKGQVLMING